MGDTKITLIHSNDIHGDFLEKDVDGVKTGGLARLSGYIKGVRACRDNVIYAIAGDMFKGSIIDSEYLGLSTIELMNLLYPDVVTLGNHEVDYGLSHLLFIEKCARFPIINANFFIKTNHARLFNPYLVVEKSGVKILFIGIITNEVLASTKSENIVGSFVDVREAANEISIICDTYKTTDIDYTVILSHIGLEEDIKLAEMLPETAGVDLIIGAHTHTLMEKPEFVNGIPIVQAGCGTNQVGRAELTFDGETHELKKFDWNVVKIDETRCEEDSTMLTMLNSYKQKTDEKYSQILTTFSRTLTHPVRNKETELGNLFADVMQDGSSFDIMILGSGSLRKTELGPIVRVQDFKEFFPYDDALHMVYVTGKQLRHMIGYVLREEAFVESGHTEYYQYSGNFRFIWSRKEQRFISFTLNGTEITDDRIIKVALQSFHFNNIKEFFDIPPEEVVKNHAPRVVGSSICGIYSELLAGMQNLEGKIDGRQTIVD